MCLCGCLSLIEASGSRCHLFEASLALIPAICDGLPLQHSSSFVFCICICNCICVHINICICICICICKPYLVISLHNRLPGTLCTELFLGSAYFIIQNIFLAPLQHLPSYLLYCGYSKKISTYFRKLSTYSWYSKKI